MPAEQYQNKRYLVLDDISGFRIMMKKMLSELGVTHVDLAGDASRAIRLCREASYDVILSDYNLGKGRNGQQLLEELNHLNLIKKTTIFIMVTAEVDKDIVLSALECQPNGYLAKPFTRGVLENRLGKIVHQNDQIKDVLVSIDDGNLQEAIRHCDEHIDKSTGYASVCLKIKGELLYRLKDYDQAMELYKEAYDSRQFDWALLGQGMVHYEKGNFSDACTVLKELVETNMHMLSAYDWLAKSLQAMGEADTAQKILEKAVSISTRSVARQQFFAEVCQDNNDMEQATNAYRKVVTLAQNSVHNSADNGLNLARCLTESAATASKSDARRLANEALTELSKVNSEFQMDEVTVQTKLVEARAFCASGQKIKGEEALRDATLLSEDLDTEITPEMKLEFARAYSSTDNKAKELEILNELALEHGGDEKITTQIDKMLDEPITETGKKKARLINSRGVKHYKDRNYAAAVKEFEIALKQSPKNIAFSLNLLHALLSESESQGGNESHMEKCNSLINSVNHLNKNHKHYKWYQDLRKRFHSGSL